MIRINREIIESTSKKAVESERKRMNFNFHPTLDDELQRMLNAIEPGTYIQPHKHEDPDKTEVFMVLKGRILVVEFDNSGEIKDFEILDATNKSWGTEIPPKTWHTIISLEPGSVAFEIKNGPYSPINDKNFASWAPPENHIDVNKYLKNITDYCLNNHHTSFNNY